MTLKEILQARRYGAMQQDNNTENPVADVSPASSLTFQQFVISAPLNEFYALFEGCTEY